MTTKVTVEAHCSDDTEVNISVTSEQTGQTTTIQSGETWEGYVYDDQAITVKESVKSKE